MIRTLLRAPARAGRIQLQKRCYAEAASSKVELKKTGLYDFHVESKAKMVPFAGYSMPLLYGSVGAVDSHNHVRTSVGLFDVGHMVQSNFTGKTATQFLEWLTPSSLAQLDPFSSTLSVLLRPDGGIIDDLIICKHEDDRYYVVTNAGRRGEDLAWITEKQREWNASDRSSAGKVHFEVLENYGLVALQGPKAAQYMQDLAPSFNFPMMPFGKSSFVDINGVKCHVARGGYTGEDGFEISIPPSHTMEITKALTQDPVQLTGLGARDSLRLEAGMCLYGHDLNESITPVEAGLSWVIGKSRRDERGGTFIGAETVLKQLKEGPSKRRVGLIVSEAPAREGAKIYSKESEEIGVVTSGIPSPTLQKNIAMGYIKSGFHKKGTEVLVNVRKQMRPAVLTPMPFVPTNYWRGHINPQSPPKAAVVPNTESPSVINSA